MRAILRGLISFALVLMVPAWAAAVTETSIPLRSDETVCGSGGNTTQVLSMDFGTSAFSSGSFSATKSFDFYSPPLTSHGPVLDSDDKGRLKIWIRNPGSGAITATCAAAFFDFDPATSSQAQILSTGASDPVEVPAGTSVECTSPDVRIGGSGYTIPSGHALKLTATIGLVSGSSFQVQYNAPSGFVGASAAVLPQRTGGGPSVEWPFGAPAACTPTPTPTPTEIVVVDIPTPTFTSSPAATPLPIVMKLAVPKQVLIIRNKPGKFRASITMVNKGAAAENISVTFTRPSSVTNVVSSTTFRAVPNETTEGDQVTTTLTIPALASRRTGKIVIIGQVDPAVSDGTVLGFSASATAADGRNASGTGTTRVRKR